MGNADAVAAFHRLARTEGILPALESSHALAEAFRRAPRLPADAVVLVNLSGRGDKDLESVRAYDAGERESAETAAPASDFAAGREGD